MISLSLSMAWQEALWAFAQWSEQFAQDWGYLGLFVINILGSASIVLPLVPSVLAIIAVAPFLNPWLIGLSSGAGAAIGELTGYYVGRGGGAIIKGKSKAWIERAERWSKKSGLFPVIILFAITPLPADIVGILAGMIKYDVKKFLLANFIGKTIKFSLLAWAVVIGIGWITAVFGA